MISALRTGGIVAALAATLGACVPAAGPSGSAILDRSLEERIPFMSITRGTVKFVPDITAGRMSSKFRDIAYLPEQIRAGHTLSIIMYDTGDPGLFTLSESAAFKVGEFIVERNGNVSLPFIGTLKVAGSTTAQAQAAIGNRLKRLAVNPFVAVRIVNSDGDSYSVQGDVASGGIFTLTARSERLLDALAAAGGPTGKPGETRVTLLRRGKSADQNLRDIVTSPRDNIRIQPKDVVIVSNAPPTYIAEGAVPAPGEYAFTPGELNLNQALARAGGLADGQADAEAVYVLRTISKAEAEASTVLASLRPNGGDIVFNIDMSDIVNKFVANEFKIVPGDIVYVGNAPLADIAKIFQILDRPPAVSAPNPRP